MEAYLILENGKVFQGQRFGASADVTGEIVFTTAMTGYIETLTDPSYFGQIVVQTFPLIGNYGMISEDFESEAPHVKAYIVKEWCQEPSNFRMEGNLDAFLKDNNIVGLCGIDTRELTKIVREYGVMNGRIVSAPDVSEKLLEEIKNYQITGAVAAVTRKEQETMAEEDAIWRVVLWDFGAKENIRRELLQRRCEVVTVPAGTSAEEILALKPDGLMLSNGPGDPAENQDIVQQLRRIMEHKIPTFGICLGHQLLALSQGAKTEKLKYGHRGANQPVKNMEEGTVFISSQNHGYAVVNDSLPEGAKLWFVNANDGTCEGIRYQNIPAFSVQFHPEACGGPHDTNFLFDRFMSLIKEEKEHAAK